MRKNLLRPEKSPRLLRQVGPEVGMGNGNERFGPFAQCFPHEPCNTVLRDDVIRIAPRHRRNRTGLELGDDAGYTSLYRRGAHQGDRPAPSGVKRADVGRRLAARTVEGKSSEDGLGVDLTCEIHGGRGFPTLARVGRIGKGLQPNSRGVPTRAEEGSDYVFGKHP